MMKKTTDIEARLGAMSYQSIEETEGALRLDKETVARIYAKTLRRAGIVAETERHGAKVRGQYGYPRLAFRKPAAATVAVLLACSIGVGSIAAAGALNKTFGQYFQTLSAGNYEKELFDVGQSASENGITVTVTQALCDGNALYVIEKTEFDPSVAVLNDAMFAVDENGGYPDAPRWGYTQLINVRETEQDPLYDLGGVVERQTGFSRLLEHDAHSMTWLRVYGGDDNLSSQVDGFFTDGKEFVLRYDGMDCVNGATEETPYDCHMEIAFEMQKVGQPQCYTLPEEVYHFTQTRDESVADMLINPWYMSFSGACLTGKVLDTDLRGEDVPAIEVVMKNGTSYTEKNGISMFRDYLGKDYSEWEYFHCDFDTPVDIANIRSVKIYGHEMKKGMVPADKTREKPYENTDGRLVLPATVPVTFSDEWKTVTYHSWEEEWEENPGPSYGHFRYRVKDVKVYDNVYATGAKNEDELMEVRLRWDSNVHYWDDSQWNHQTGQLGKDMYVLEYEVEITNIDANFREDLSTFDWNNTGYFENLFGLVLRNDSLPSDDWGDPLYIRENEYAVTGQLHSIRLPQGETRTFHVSFAVQDNHAGAFEQVGFRLCSDKEQIEYANLSKLIQEFNQSRK